MTETRPDLTQDMSVQELQRWYWLRTELAGFARSVGVATSGSKQELTTRVVAYLDGGTPTTSGTRRPAPPPPLAEPLTTATLIPAGQRCTQQLRHDLTKVIGPSFRFDAAMRDFITGGAGQTLGAAVEHWHGTRSQPRPAIGVQFELNRFLRDWHHTIPKAPVSRLCRRGAPTAPYPWRLVRLERARHAVVRCVLSTILAAWRSHECATTPASQ